MSTYQGCLQGILYQTFSPRRNYICSYNLPTLVQYPNNSCIVLNMHLLRLNFSVEHLDHFCSLYKSLCPVSIVLMSFPPCDICNYYSSISKNAN